MRPIRRGKSPSKNRSKSSLISIIGVTTLPRSQDRTQRLTGANKARFRWGCYHYPRSVPDVSETLRGRVLKRHTLPFFAWGGEGVHGRKAESLRNGDAHRARLRSEAPRPRRAALLRCCCSRRADRLRGFHALCCTDSFACTLCRSTALSSAVNCRS